MKQINSISLILIALVAISFTSCDKKDCTESYSYMAWIPEYMPYDEFRASVATDAPMDLEKPGKIYIKDNWLFINEFKKGIHILDNSNPANPVPVSFISIPGNVDMAVKGDVLYADSHVDLVSLDISDPTNATEIDRDEDIFPYTIEKPSNFVDPSLGIIVGWKQEYRMETVKCGTSRNNSFGGGGGGFEPQLNTTDADAFFGGAAEGGGAARDGGSASGTGGSMARFTIVNDILYTVNENDMQLFDISNTRNPNHTGDVAIGWNIETIFPYNDHLFIGSQNGMFIYNNDNPLSPELVGEYWHMTSCDPVVVHNNYAYVTLRSGTNCGGWLNMLDVVNLDDYSAPFQEASYDMENPYGLGIDQSEALFVCDGEAGLKVYKLDDPVVPELVRTFTGHETYDVIPNGNVIIVIGPDGLYQYSYNETYELSLLSKIAVPVTQ